jgi:hypothetical protein
MTGIVRTLATSLEPEKEIETFQVFTRRTETFPRHFCQNDQMNSAVESLGWPLGAVSLKHLETSPMTALSVPTVTV